MNTEEMIRLCKEHTMYSWAKNDAVDPLPIERADGVYMYTPDGDKILDFNSQLMCVNIGHNHPKVKAAIKEQLDKLTYVYPGTATEVRAKLGKRLSEITPGDINTFFFTIGGAEANENAIKAARLFTGKYKIITRYRSYHGATNACMQLSGDPRRWANEPGMPGVVRVMDPSPYTYSFGDDDEEITANNLRYLEEVIMMEGPQNIAAMFIETVTGTNGILPPPKGYLKGLRELLTKHDILMVCDEVMSGFGRTGKMYAFEHGDIVPDIVTMAKGLTSAYLPLGAMGVSDRIADFFRKNMFWGGLTYNAHALGMATVLANIDVLVDEGMIDKHPSAKSARQIGLFGMMDVQKNAKGEPFAGFNSTHPVMTALAKHFRDNGMFTFVKWGSFMCNPPLCITEEQILEGFAIIDSGFDLCDAAFESEGDAS